MSQRRIIKLSSLDITSLSVMGVLIVLILLVAFTGSRIGVRVVLEGAAATGEVGAFSPILLHFSQPVALASLQGLVQITPNVPGNLIQKDPRTVTFIPNAPFETQISYSLRIDPGNIGVNGEPLKHAQEWDFRVRTPRILYVSTEMEYELWSIGPDGESPKRLTFTGGRVYTFSVSPDGEKIAYAQINNQSGYDLWLIGRDGDSPRLLLDCQGDRCESPAWAPDGSRIAYSRQSVNVESGEATGVPRLWQIDIENGETAAVFSDPFIMGKYPFWSPDGRWLASVDQLTGNLRVVELSTGKTILFPAKNISGKPGSWSPDSRYVFYLAFLIEGKKQFSHLMQGDINNGENVIVWGEKDEYDHSYSVPVWSPDGKTIVGSLQMSQDIFLKSIWKGEDRVLTEMLFPPQENYTYDNYNWDPSGRMIVLQGAKFNINLHPGIFVWTPEHGIHLVVEDAMLPQWLP